MTTTALPAALALLLLCAGAVAAEDSRIGEKVSSPLQYYDQFEPEMPDDHMIRIRRDFNNDGREDQAIADSQASCGNKACGFDVWLQDETKQFRLVGTLQMLWWGYGLVKKAPGVAELQNCSGTGVEFWGMDARTISMKGIVYDRERSQALSKAGKCQIVDLKSYPCERCSLKKSKPSKCKWTRCQ